MAEVWECLDADGPGAAERLLELLRRGDRSPRPGATRPVRRPGSSGSRRPAGATTSPWSIPSAAPEPARPPRSRDRTRPPGATTSAPRSTPPNCSGGSRRAAPVDPARRRRSAAPAEAAAEARRGGPTGRPRRRPWRRPAPWNSTPSFGASSSPTSSDLFGRIQELVLGLGGGDDAGRLHELGRCFHTLKGAAGSVGLGGLAAAIHALEDELERGLPGSQRSAGPAGSRARSRCSRAVLGALTETESAPVAAAERDAPTAPRDGTGGRRGGPAGRPVRRADPRHRVPLRRADGRRLRAADAGGGPGPSRPSG